MGVNYSEAKLEQSVGQMALEIARLRTEVAKLAQAVNQRPAALPTYVPFTAAPEDERIIDIGGIALSELREMKRYGQLSEENGILKNIGKGSKYPRWLVHVPALVEKLRCDRDLL